MSVVSSSEPEVLTSAERWERWEQRGRDNDARFRRRLRGVLSTAAILGAVLLLFWLFR